MKESMKGNIGKKFLSLFLSAVMVLGMLPATAFATEEAGTCTEHNYVEGICETCGQLESSAEDEEEATEECTEHDYDEDGICTVCGAEEVYLPCDVEGCDLVLGHLGDHTGAALYVEAVDGVYEVDTETELKDAIGKAADDETVMLTADITVDQLQIYKPITLNLGGKTLTTTSGYGGILLKEGPSVVNGNIIHEGKTAAIKAFKAKVIKDLVIDVTYDGSDGPKVIGGIVVQNKDGKYIDSIKDVTIKGVGLTNGIETYNCGDKDCVIGTMENVNIDAVGTGMLLSAPCGTATNCSISGGVTGIDMLLKGTYSVSIDLVNCDVYGGKQAVYAHDEQKDYTYEGTLSLTVDSDTTFDTAEGGELLVKALEETTDADLSDVEIQVWDGVIDDLAELKWFRDQVNGGKKFEGKTVKLNADINLDGLNWTPIGNDTNYFWGTFDGQDHTISNMTINVNTPDANQVVGLFGGVRKATLKNFKLTDVNIDVVGAKVRAAAVVAIAHSNSENHTTANLNFENITVDGCTINAEAKSNSVAVGGLSGYCYPANMKGISVSNLTINPKASGSVFAGGMVGYMQGQNISNNGNTRAYYTVDTFNLNNITIKSETNDSLIGGFAGYTYYGYITLKNAAINGFKVEANVAKEALIGGLIGLAHRSDKGHTFTDVEITGLDIDVVSDSGVDVLLGGMVGYSGSPIAYSDCAVSGTITETCRNTPSSAIAGGFVGGTVSWAQSYSNCVADVNVTGTNYTGGFVGYNGVTATYTDCEAKGTVVGTTAGGFVGDTVNGTYIECTYTGESNVPFCGTESVTSLSYVAEAGGTKYTSLQAAVDAAQPGDTVKVLASHKIDKFVTIDKSITLDLNEQTITRNGGTALYVNAADAVVTITGDGTVESDTAEVLYVNAGTVKVMDGTFTSGHAQGPAVYVINNGHAEIYGGTFSNGSGEFVLNEYDKTRNATTITVYGGTFVGFNPENNAAEGANTNFVAPGLYRATETATGVYTVAEWNYEIHNKADLLFFQKAANAGNTFPGKTIKLMADVNLEGMTWTPIAKFAGTFEGGNHTISNFHVDATAGHGGFFNVLEWAKVYKLNLADVTATVGAYRFGTLARSINQTCVENVTVENVTVTTTNSSAFVAGLFCHGIVNSNMEVNNCTVENLTVNAENGAYLIGGITTFVQKNGTEAEGTNIFDNLQVKNFKVTVADTDGVCGVGGLVGQTQSVWQNPRFNNCSVTGLDVTASGKVDVGGFMAYPGSWTYAEDCTVEGKIDVTGVTSADSYAGGFFSNYGWGDNVSKGDHKVINCSADVDIITKMANAGGFVGSGINTEGRNKNITFTGCTASGDITAVEGGTANIGGFAGYTDRGVFESCTASGTVTNNGTGYAGQFVGKLNEDAFNITYKGSFKDCTYTGASTTLKFIGNEADATIITSVAEVNGTKYTSLQAAINACTNGETVKLIADITYGADDVVYAHGGATGFGKYDQYNPSIIYIGGTKGATEAENQPSDVNAVLDLNGHTVQCDTEAYMFLIMDNAKLTFKDSVGGGKVINNSTSYPAIWACGTDTLVTIASGTYQTKSALGLIHATHSGDLVIEGGHFSTTADDASLLLMINSQKYNNPNYFLEGIATLTVKGGTFVGFNPEKVGDDYGASSIEDIKFVNGCALGYEAKDNGDGTYGVQPWDRKIENKDDLLMFAAMANAGNNFSGETIELLADIDMEWAEWMAVTCYATFNGNDHTISNLTYVPTETGRMGFFQSIGGPVKDLTLDGIKGTVPADGRFGGFARYLNAAVENVHVKNIEVTTTDTLAWVGGFTSYTAGGSTNNCSVTNLTVNAQAGADLIGGFIALTSNRQLYQNCTVDGFKVTINDTHSSGCGVGGFAAQTQTGWNNPKFANDVVKNIDVVASGLVDVGGFIAWPGAHTEYATNCHTQGTIDVTGVTSSDCFAGGFFGNLGWNCDLGYKGHKVVDCTADVEIITKMADAGGFVGSATNSNNNSMYAEFYNCSASGDITVISGGEADVGGFAGDADRGVYEGCSASGIVKNNGTGYAGQFIGAMYDVTPKYDGRYPAGTRDYPVDESTLADCTYTGTSTNLKFIGNTEDGADVEIVEYVAAIGDQGYASLQAAIDKAQPNDTIVLLSDINIADVELQTLGGKYKTCFLVEDKTVTIDMADHTISGTYTGGSMLVGVFSTDTKGHLTLTGNGTIDVTAAGTVYSLIVCYSDDDSTITIENGTYKLDKASDSLIYSDSDESVTVNGGSFTLGNVGTGSNGSPWIFNASGQNTKNIIVTGGTYNADIFHQFYIFEVKDTTEVAELLKIPAKAAKNNGDGTWTIVDAVALVNEQHKSGNWYTQNTGYATLQEAIDAVKTTESSNTEFVTLLADGLSVEGVNKPVTIMKNDHTATIKTADGFKVVEDNEKYEVVAGYDPVAQIGEGEDAVQYKTLTDAIKDGEGKTITLLKDVTENVTVDKNLTIDGANFKYTGGIDVSGNTTALTVKNVNFVDYTDNYAITTNRINSITVENCTLNGYDGFLYANKSTPTVVVKNVTMNGGIYGMHWVYGTTATLENVTMTDVTYGLYIQNYAGKTINIKDSTISSIAIWERTGSSGVQTFNFEGANTVDTLSTSQYAKYVLAAADATLTAPAGLDVVTNVEGYEVVHENGTYKLAAQVAQIFTGDVAGAVYTSVAEALAAAKSGETVKLVADATEAGIVVTSGRTLDLNGFDLTTDYLFAARGAYVMDNTSTLSTTTEKDIGHLYVDKNNLVLSADNGEYFPVWVGDCYQFGDAYIRDNELNEAEVSLKSGTLTYKFRYDFEGKKNGLESALAEDPDVLVVIKLRWIADNGKESEQQFTVTQTELKAMAEATKNSVKLTATGADAISEISVCSALISTTNVEYQSEWITLQQTVTAD